MGDWDKVHAIQGRKIREMIAANQNAATERRLGKGAESKESWERVWMDRLKARQMESEDGEEQAGELQEALGDGGREPDLRHVGDGDGSGEQGLVPSEAPTEPDGQEAKLEADVGGQDGEAKVDAPRRRRAVRKAKAKAPRQGAKSGSRGRKDRKKEVGKAQNGEVVSRREEESGQKA